MSVPPPRVLVDANVIYSNDIRNLFMSLAVNRVIELRWSEEIEDEWVRNRAAALLRNGRPTEAPSRTATMMRAALPGWSTPSNHPFLRACGSTDPKDVHVAASALSVKPCSLVTWNLADFDAATLADGGVEVIDPDSFLLGLAASDPDGVLDGVRYALRFSGMTDLRSFIARFGRTAKSGSLPAFAAAVLEMLPGDGEEPDQSGGGAGPKL